MQNAKQLPFSSNSFSAPPVVGIVGSTGSRQALDMLFRNLPEDSGMCFVIVLRIGSQQVERLPALLQKRSEMHIVAATDGVSLQADHVYIAPATVQVTVVNNALKLTPIAKGEEGTVAGALDSLLFSLAESYGAEAMVVLLSGTGADGVAGAERICKGEGLVFIQDMDEAAHGALPRRAQKACPNAVTATAGEIARQLVQAKGDLADAVHEEESAAKFDQFYAAVLKRLATHTGHDLSHYKVSTLHRRIARRMAMAGVSSLDQYVALLESSQGEARALFKDSLVSVTSFFRDTDAYDMLERDCIPQLFVEKGHKDYVRVWVAGCATGQEAYSVAMQLMEYAEKVGEPPRLQVFATDLDEEAIAFARRGIYPAAIAKEMTPGRLSRFFTQDHEGYHVKPEIREHVLFAVHDLLRDPPFSRLDLITCRNVLIYFNRKAQEALFATFHYALNSQGYLFLGTSESTDAAPDLFAVLDKHCHLYQRCDVVLAPQRQLPSATLNLLGERSSARNRASQSVSPRAVEEVYASWSLRVHTPPRLLVNTNYEITHLFGEVGRYLREPEGPVTQNILQRILPDLRLDLRTALYQAFNKSERSISRTLRVEVNGATDLLRLHVGPITEVDFPKELVEVVFVADQGSNLLELAATGDVVETDMALVMRMEEELMRNRERLQAIIEEYEDSSQELKTSNEELQSINEELKSTTEELETSKEELQSMNEELTTVNSDLTQKIEEINRANSDLLNFIASTDVGAIFLNSDLRISRFTPRATELFNLLEADHGRPFNHITHRIRHSNIDSLATHVRDTSERIEETVQDNAERWFVLRLFPYQTVTGKIDGVVITFFDISDLKRAESEERQRHQQQVLATLSRQALADADLDLLFAETTQRVAEVLDMEMCKVLELQPDKTTLLLRTGVGWQPGLVGQANVPADIKSQAGYTLHAQGPVIVRDLKTEPRFQGPSLLVEHGVRSGISTTIHGADGPYGVLGVHSRKQRSFTPYDVDFLQSVANVLAAAIARQRAAAELRASESALRHYVNMIEAAYDAIIVWSPEHGIEFWNEGAQELYGYSADEAIGRATHELLATRHPAPIAEIMQLLQTNGEWEGELIHHARDGRVIYVSSRHQLVTGANSKSAILEINRDITERKEFEQLLEERNAILSGVLESNNDAIFVRDLEGRYLLVNTAGAQQVQMRPDEIIGKRYQELFPDDVVAIEKDDELVLEKGIAQTFEHASQQNGDVRYWNTLKMPLRSADGRRLGMVSSARDITERVWAEAELQARETQLRLITDNVSGLISYIDRDERYRFVNAVYEAWLCAASHEIIGRTVQELLDKAAYAVAQPYITRALSGEQVTFENNVRYPDGVTRTVLTTYVPDVATPNANEDPSVGAAQSEIRGFYALVIDITESKKAEEELRRTHETLALAQRTSQSGIWDWDIANNKTFWSPEFYALYGLDPQMPASQEAWLATVHPDDQARIEMRLREVLEGYSDWNEEFRITHPARGERWLLGVGQVSSDEDGNPIRLTGLNIDITERRAVEAQLRYQAQLLENVQDAVISTDANFQIRTWNSGAEQLYGWSAAEVVGLPLADLLRTQFPNGDVEQARTELRKQGSWRGEVIQHTRGGEPINVSNVTVVIRDEAGAPVGAVAVNRDITHKKDAEALLARYQLFSQQARDIILFMRLDGQIVEANAAALEAYGYNRATLLKMSIYDLRDPATHAQIIEQLAQADEATTGQGVLFETVHRRQNGSTFPVEVSSIGADVGGERLLMSVIRDISERKAAEAMIAASEAKFSTAFSLSPLVLTITSMSTGRFIEVNESFERTTGYTRDEVLGRTPDELALWAAAQERQVGLALLAKGKTIENVEALFRMKNGELRTFLLGATQVEINGEPCTLTALTDITERKAAEAALQASEMQLRLVTENISGLVSYIDREERYRFVNGVYERWFAQPREQIIGRTVFEGLGQMGYERVQPYLARALAGERVSFESTLTYADGVTRTVMVTYAPDAGEGEQVRGVYALVNDITERKRAEERLHFLVQASDILASSLDYNTTLENVARAAVPQIADWCVIDLLMPDGSIADAGLAHADPEKIRWAEELRQRYPVDPAAPAGGPHVIRTGISEFYPNITDDMLTAVAKNAEELHLLRSVGYRSVMVVPLPTHDRILGAISLVSTESQRLFSEEDLRMAEELGRRAAVAIENAQLYQSLRQRQAELRQSEGRFRNAFEQAAVGMAHLDLDGRYLRVNDRICDILEYTRDELLQKTFIEITHPDDLEADLAEMGRQMAGEIAVHSMEKRYLRGDGNYIWANMTASVVADEDGAAQYGLVVIEDISPQKEADAARRRSEKRFRAVQQATPDGFMIFESVRDDAESIVDFRWLYINPAAEQIVGRSHSDLVGKRLLEEMPGNREEGLFDAYVNVVETGEVWQREFHYMHEGLNHWFRSTAAKAEDGFAVSFANVTKQKEMERALAESETRFRSTFEQAAVGMAHTDAHGYYIQVNDRLCEILGYTRAELLQKHSIELIHPGERARSEALNAQLISGELPRYDVEKRYIRSDGSPIWVHVTASSVRAESGEAVYRLAVVEDISARKAAEAALQELNATLEQRIQLRTAELERSNQELDQFAYVASHDLKAPLRAIDHLAGWISEDSGQLLPLASQDHLEKLRSRAQRMEMLLDDLLTYSRAGRIQGEAVEVALGDLVDNVISLIAPPNDFEITREPDLPTIRTHRAPLELVLRNLIGNAIKHHHSAREKSPGHVHIRAVERGDFIEFAITDNGPGIAPEYHERIFGMFQTLRPRDEVEGSGIGLAVVKKTVESLHGRVWVESAPGEGATFFFTWPQRV